MVVYNLRTSSDSNIGFTAQIVAAFSNGQGNEYFYASLYAGLYYESEVCSQHLNLSRYFVLQYFS